MAQLGGLVPQAVAFNGLGAPATGNILIVWRAAGPCEVVGAWGVSDATIATTTNTAQLEILKLPAGAVGSAVQAANFDAASGWTADVPRSGTLGTVANRKLVAGDCLAVRATLAGTGVFTALQAGVDLVAGHRD